MFKRFRWHFQRIRRQFGGKVLRPLIITSLLVTSISAVAVTAIEEEITWRNFGQTLYWALMTILDARFVSYVTTPWGWVFHWTLALFGVAVLAAFTGAVVGFVVDFLVKEGQGMGASGYEGHIVICGWNTTARELVEELRSDDYQVKIVLIHDADRNPAGEHVYYVRGDTAAVEDLERAGIAHASAAIICPTEPGDAADMRSLLIALAIENLATGVRTVVEVNNPKHVEHFTRIHVDEILVTSRLSSRLLARTAMYPGLGTLVTDIVSGGEGSELYGVHLPDEYVGLGVDELSARLRREHHATLLAVVRDGKTYANPDSSFRLVSGDEAVVVAVSLGTLSPLVATKATGMAP